MGDIIQTSVLIYKMAPSEMKSNIYGESDPNSGKFFYQGVEVTCLIDRADITADFNEFGADRSQVVVFKFRENMLKLVGLYPEIGDVIRFNERYHTINNVVQEQFLFGGEDKSHSIICSTNYSRLSKLSFVQRQV